MKWLREWFRRREDRIVYWRIKQHEALHGLAEEKKRYEEWKAKEDNKRTTRTWGTG